MSLLASPLQPTCACGAILPDAVRPVPKLRGLALLLLSLLLLPLCLGALIHGEVQRQRWTSAPCDVIAAVLEVDDEARVGRLTVRYRVGGAERTRHVYRTSPLEKATHEWEVARERAFLERFKAGTQATLWLDPDDAEVALLERHPRTFAIAGLLLLAWFGLGGLDILAQGLWGRMQHVACELEPGRSRAWLDHRHGVGSARWLGPNVACSSMLAGALSVGAALFWGRVTLPWLGLVGLTTLALLVALVRYLLELRNWRRWRTAELWLEPPRVWRPGGGYTAALLDRPGRALTVSCELRAEERWSDGVWSGEVAARGEAKALPAPEGTTIELKLPGDAVPPAREEGCRRRRWVVRVRDAGTEALFELDFVPSRVPVADEDVHVPLADEWMDETRRDLGPAPREPRDFRKVYPPPWMDEEDLLQECLRQQQTLLREGQVVWGAVVQANASLYGPGAEDSTATVLYSLDPELELGRLLDMAHRLAETKEHPIDRLSQALADEVERLLRARAAEWLTGDARDVFLAMIVVPRSYLPDARLRASFFPLLVAPEHTRAAMLLPSAYWGTALRQRWRELATAEALGQAAATPAVPERAERREPASAEPDDGSPDQADEEPRANAEADDPAGDGQGAVEHVE
ncbi:MAG: hypothetical protein AB7N76_15760 [Planctomycetota bacterium]